MVGVVLVCVVAVSVPVSCISTIFAQDAWVGLVSGNMGIFVLLRYAGRYDSTWEGPNYDLGLVLPNTW